MVKSAPKIAVSRYKPSGQAFRTGGAGRRYLWLLCCILALAGNGEAQSPPAGQGTYAITHVTVIDGTGAPPLQDATVVISGGRITALGNASGVRVPGSAVIVDGRGKYLIPGLWDMHVHTSTRNLASASIPRDRDQNSRFLLPGFVVHGITGVRDMSGDLPRLQSWRQRIARGELIGPRMVITGYKFGSERAVLDGAPFPLRTPADIRTAVEQLKRAGGDFVKSGGELAPALLDVLASEARRHGLMMVGHVPEFITADHFAMVGGRSIEHLSGIVTGCDPLPIPSIWSRVVAIFRPGGETTDPLRNHCSPAGMTRLAQVLVEKSVYQVPTLIQLQAMARVPGLYNDDEERSAFIPPALRQPAPPPPPADRLELLVQQFDRAKRMVGELHRLGVPMMAGTDLPGTERLPGFSLVDELALFVESGLTPGEALLTATRNPAMFLGTIDSLGTVARGTVADLVLLDANPLDNIRNVSRVNLVMLAGKPYTAVDLRQHRTEIIAELERMSGSRAGN